MRREGRVRGKPSSKSRKMGQSKFSRDMDNNRLKRRGRHKRYAVDVFTNPSLAEFCLEAPLPASFVGHDCELDEEAVQVTSSIVTVNSLIEAALARDDETMGTACTSADNLRASEGAPHKELETFKSASFSMTQLARKWGSEESWSDVDINELSELDSSEHEEEWFVVLHGADDDHL